MQIETDIKVGSLNFTTSSTLILPKQFENMNIKVLDGPKLGIDLDVPIPNTKHVYLIHGYENNYILGYGDSTKNLKKYQRGNPHELKIIACCPGDKKLKLYFHNKYLDYRIRDEWFSLSIETTNLIVKEMCEFLNVYLQDKKDTVKLELSKNLNINCYNNDSKTIYTKCEKLQNFNAYIYYSKLDDYVYQNCEFYNYLLRKYPELGEFQFKFNKTHETHEKFNFNKNDNSCVYSPQNKIPYEAEMQIFVKEKCGTTMKLIPIFKDIYYEYMTGLCVYVSGDKMFGFNFHEEFLLPDFIKNHFWRELRDSEENTIGLLPRFPELIGICCDHFGISFDRNGSDKFPIRYGWGKLSTIENINLLSYWEISILHYDLFWNICSLNDIGWDQFTYKFINKKFHNWVLDKNEKIAVIKHFFDIIGWFFVDAFNSIYNHTYSGNETLTIKQICDFLDLEEDHPNRKLD